MRAAQIGFFKSPKGSQERQGFYKQSKDLEAAVDAYMLAMGAAASRGKEGGDQ